MASEAKMRQPVFVHTVAKTAFDMHFFPPSLPLQSGMWDPSPCVLGVKGIPGAWDPQGDMAYCFSVGHSQTWLRTALLLCIHSRLSFISLLWHWCSTSADSSLSEYENHTANLFPSITHIGKTDNKILVFHQKYIL